MRNDVLDHGEEIGPGIIAHYDRDGDLIEIEILDASEIAIEIVKKLSEYRRNTMQRP